MSHKERGHDVTQTKNIDRITKAIQRNLVRISIQDSSIDCSNSLYATCYISHMEKCF